MTRIYTLGILSVGSQLEQLLSSIASSLQQQQQPKTQSKSQFSPLQIPPPSSAAGRDLADHGAGPVPPRGGLPVAHAPHSMAYGDDDLYPGGLGGGGMMLGPSHPMFAARMPREEFAYGDPRRLRPTVPGLPPRARFDMFGPGGRLGSDPDPDHLPPPGYGDMFM